jgi:uncharacterized protein
MLPKFTSEDHAYVRRPPAAGPRLPTRRLPRRSGQQRMGGIPATRSASLAYSVDSYWRNRAEFVQGRPAIIDFLTRKWTRELDYRLIKELWSFTDNRIAVRFAYEWRDDSLNWFRSFGNENWEFYSNRLMQRRFACINDLPIKSSERKFYWDRGGPRPNDQPGLSALTL